MQIDVAISELIEKYAKSPWDINNGDCEGFALDLIEMIGGEDWDTNCLGDYGDLCELLPGHVWVWKDGKHYDAECPEGVTDPLELPIFNRTIGILTKQKA